jgi:hypothetical protein
MPDLRQQIRAHYEAQTLSADKVDAILSRGRAAAAGEQAAETAAKVVELPRARRRWMPALAIAACLAVFAGLFALMQPRGPDMTALALHVVEFFGSGSEPRERSQDSAALRAWLIAKGAPADFQIPERLLPLKSFGCDVLNVGGRPAFLTCFWREKKPDGTGGELVHLIVARRDDFRKTPAAGEVQQREMDGWSFASWSHGDVIYTLAAAAPAEVLKPFIGARRATPFGIAKLSF